MWSPDSKAILAILPSSSTATVTPWTATKEPTASTVRGHCSRRTRSAVTVSGGVTIGVEPMTTNCEILTAVGIPTSRSRPTRVIAVFVAVVRRMPMGGS
jgi:hypothetical protein